MKNRIVITGSDCITPYGMGKNSLFEGMQSGMSCIDTIGKFDTGNFTSKRAGHINNFNVSAVIKDSTMLRVPFLDQIAVAGARMALNDGSIKARKLKDKIIALYLGTEGPKEPLCNILQEITDGTPANARPIDFQETVTNAPASRISIIEKIKGPVVVPAKALHGLYWAFLKLIHKKIDFALVGGVDEYSKAHYDVYADMNILSPIDDHDEACKPFDKNRNGMIFSEGAAFMLLERLESALERDVPILGEILAVSMVGDGYRNGGIDSSGAGFELSMQKVLDRKQQSVDDVDLVITAACGSPNVDRAEALAIKKVFAGKTADVPVTNLKSYTGYLKCTDGMIEILSSLQIFKEQNIPPMMHSLEPEINGGLSYVTKSLPEKEINTILINSYLWGGIYNSILIKKRDNNE